MRFTIKKSKYWAAPADDLKIHTWQTHEFVTVLSRCTKCADQSHWTNYWHPHWVMCITIALESCMGTTFYPNPHSTHHLVPIPKFSHVWKWFVCFLAGKKAEMAHISWFPGKIVRYHHASTLIGWSSYYYSKICDRFVNDCHATATHAVAIIVPMPMVLPCCLTASHGVTVELTLSPFPQDYSDFCRHCHSFMAVFLLSPSHAAL